MDENDYVKPLADEEKEAWLKSCWADWDKYCPGEWLARYGWTLGSSSANDYCYRDKVWQEWIYHTFKLIHTPGAVEEMRQKFLTPEEIAEQDRMAKEAWS